MKIYELHIRLSALIEADKGHLEVETHANDGNLEPVTELDQYADVLILGQREGVHHNEYRHNSNYDVPHPDRHNTSFLGAFWSEDIKAVYIKRLLGYYENDPRITIPSQATRRMIYRAGQVDGRFGSGGLDE
jgi:hypothetical protein